MKKECNGTRYWRLRTTLLFLVLIGVALLQYQQSSSAASNNWSWEDQLQMEASMAKAAQLAPATVPEIDRSIPETETALFALG